MTTTKFSVYGSKADSIGNVWRICETLRVSPYRLAKLLGLPFVSVIYLWLNGQQRPGPKYAMRMVHLLVMVLTGEIKQLPLVSSIDWDTGWIHFRPGLGSKRMQGAAPNAGAKFMEAGEKFLSPATSTNGHSRISQFLEARP